MTSSSVRASRFGIEFRCSSRSISLSRNGDGGRLRFSLDGVGRESLAALIGGQGRSS
jgi:hypothetical protein